MKIYNSKTRKLEEFKTSEPGIVKIYSCGPTVYDLIHVGNARPLVVFDCFRRFLEYSGLEVIFVQNFTDIDDKIIKKANELKVSAESVSNKFIDEFYEDSVKLGVKKATIAPRVSGYIEKIIAFIEKLIEKKHAYVVEGNVFFDVKSFEKYGELSGIRTDELEVKKEVEVGGLKKNNLDFALWKAAKKDEPYWVSPWGNGRPGWHIECSVMAIDCLGETIDLHCGGKDLIFPHHENEIAQSEAATGKEFARFWMHNGHINVKGEKMSKSLKNFITVRNLAAEIGYLTVRFILLQVHYRMPINLTEEFIESGKGAVNRLIEFNENLKRAEQNANLNGHVQLNEERLFFYKSKFIEALEQDFNTAEAIAALFEFVREMNGLINNEKNKLKMESLKLIRKLFNELTEILGLEFTIKVEETPIEILKLLEKRKLARLEKNFELADLIRNEIESLGYIVKETRFGSVVEKKKT